MFTFIFDSIIVRSGVLFTCYLFVTLYTTKNRGLSAGNNKGLREPQLCISWCELFRAALSSYWMCTNLVHKALTKFRTSLVEIVERFCQKNLFLDVPTSDVKRRETVAFGNHFLPHLGGDRFRSAKKQNFWILTKIWETFF